VFNSNVLYRYSGPTVHFVDEHYDTGKTLAQKVVPVFADDTPELLAARVLHEVRVQPSSPTQFRFCGHTIEVNLQP
jgi:folate-dependent phosphoribosylglycinamide formyltransferase PurN